jgi:hypothetical protein
LLARPNRYGAAAAALLAVLVAAADRKKYAQTIVQIVQNRAMPLGNSTFGGRSSSHLHTFTKRVRQSAC